MSFIFLSLFHIPFTMSGHVTYACPCLNIKIHLASKYSLNNHVSDRQKYWFQQEDPALEGWLVELGMGAVVVVCEEREN